MKFHTHREEHGTLSEINIVPMVDIMLVLLIIFMVTAPMLQQGIDINLPEVTSSNVEMNQEDFVLSVGNDGQIFINDDSKNKFSIVSIEEQLMTAFKDKNEKALYLRADQSIKYGYIMEVMAACRRAGVERIGMITRSRADAEFEEQNSYKSKRKK